MSDTTEHHCATCTCGKRAPVQSSPKRERGAPGHGPGTVAWAEHLLAWGGYAKENGCRQTAERMAERGGFSYYELTLYLGREPSTWRPASA
jgi:hypothetical protein